MENLNIERMSAISKRKNEILAKEATCRKNQERSLDNSLLLNDIENNNCRYLLNLAEDSVAPEPDSSAYRDLFPKQYKELENNIINVKIEYKAYHKETLVYDDSIYSKLNTYKSPFKIYNVTDQASLPEVYSDFFTHLFPDPNEREYVLDWIATSIHKKVLCYLCLFGDEGIGKGVFGGILKRLHLSENYVEIGDKTLKSDFNGEIKDRTLIFADEVKINSAESMNILKGLVNDTILINDKNEKKVSKRNYASVVICSNEWDAVKLNETSRRFSIPEVSKIKLINSLIIKNKYISEANLCDELFRHDNIAFLFSYLVYRYKSITRDMNRALQGDYFNHVLSNQLSDWESLAVSIIRERSPNRISSTEILNAIESAGICTKYNKPSQLRLFKFVRERFQRNIQSTKNGKMNTFYFTWVNSSNCFTDKQGII